MRASIVVPSHRGADTLRVLLPALSAQTFTAFEVIVVIDGVVDESEQVVADHDDGRVHTVVLPENRGRVSALDAGFAEASGDLLVRCDDDLEPETTWLAALVAAVDGGAEAVIGRTVNQYAVENGYVRAYGRSADRRVHAQVAAAAPDQLWRHWAANCAVTRGVWERVGDYDNRYIGYGWEDVDYGYRLHRAGVQIVLAPGADAVHHAGAVDARTRLRRAFASGRGRVTFEKIHGVAASGAVHRPTGVWGLVVQGLALTMRSDGSVQRAGGVIDDVLRVVPRGLGARLVAAGVEAAAMSGHSRPGAPSSF